MITSLCLFILGIVAYGLKELQSHKKLPWMYERGTGFWDGDSHLRKYKDLNSTKGPKFLFSTTLLVGLTDGYHLLQTIYIILFCVATVLYRPMFERWQDFAIYYGTWHIVFWAVYNSFKKKLK